MTQNIQHIPASKISAGDNDRKAFDPVALARLAASIRKRGLAQYPVVRPYGAGFQIVAGERRIRAMRDILGYSEIPCDVRPMDDETASDIMLIENMDRENLNAIEEGLAFQKRLATAGDIAVLAEALNLTVDYVRNRLGLLTLHEGVQHFVRTGALGIGHALCLVGLDHNRQRIAMRVFNARPGLTLTAFKDIVATLRQEQFAEESNPMFELELVAQVEAARPQVRSGRKAITNAIGSASLPPVRIKPLGDSTGDVLERYITDLLDAGETTAAHALANVLNSLVMFNYARMPQLPTLPSAPGAPTVDSVAHHERITQ